MRRFLIIMMVCLFMAGTSIVAIAASVICNSSYDGYHHYDSHRTYMSGYSEPAGICCYIIGYQGGNPIYRNDCRLTRHLAYCDYVCSFCGDTLEGGQHTEEIAISHSIIHN